MELWMPINAEVRSLSPIASLSSLDPQMRTLLNDYITDAEQSTIATVNPVSSINEVLRDGRLVRDKTKVDICVIEGYTELTLPSQHAFRFAETDLKTSNKALKAHEDELTQVLRDFVPGLVQGPSETTVQSTLSALGTDERMLGSSQHHRLLIKPDAFHVSVLFQPTLAFLSRIADILPSGMESARASTAVLDEFVLKVYLPQLEQKVTSLFLQAVSGKSALAQRLCNFMGIRRTRGIPSGSGILAFVGSTIE
jgi:exocyst complex component 4